MRRRLTIWILALTLVGAFGLIGCDKKEETGAEKVKQDVSEMAEEGVKAIEPCKHNPPNRKRLQGAAYARRTGTQTYSLYFKCPTTKQMRCPVDAYIKYYVISDNLTSFS